MKSMISFIKKVYSYIKEKYLIKERYLQVNEEKNKEVQKKEVLT